MDILVVGHPSSEDGKVIRKIIEDKIENSVKFQDESDLIFSGHPLANVGYTITELKEIDDAIFKDNRFNSLPENQTYTPTVNRKTKRW